MKTRRIIVAAALTMQHLGLAAPESPVPGPGHASTAAPAAAEQDRESRDRADKRYEEMLGKMQAAVEEVAQLYGNPVFLQVFTNDMDRAEELKRRLRTSRSEEDIRKEMADLEKKRDELLNDIALKQREASRLADRLVRQRAALDALAEAVEQARRAVEDSSK